MGDFSHLLSSSVRPRLGAGSPARATTRAGLHIRGNYPSPITLNIDQFFIGGLTHRSGVRG